MLDEIGLPKGVFNLVSRYGSTVGSHLASHPEVDMVSFTGSTAAGVRFLEMRPRVSSRLHSSLAGRARTSSRRWEWR